MKWLDLSAHHLELKRQKTLTNRVFVIRSTVSDGKIAQIMRDKIEFIGFKEQVKEASGKLNKAYVSDISNQVIKDLLALPGVKLVDINEDLIDEVNNESNADRNIRPVSENALGEVVARNDSPDEESGGIRGVTNKSRANSDSTDRPVDGEDGEKPSSDQVSGLRENISNKYDEQTVSGRAGSSEADIPATRVTVELNHFNLGLHRQPIDYTQEVSGEVDLNHNIEALRALAKDDLSEEDKVAISKYSDWEGNKHALHPYFNRYSMDAYIEGAYETILHLMSDEEISEERFSPSAQDNTASTDSAEMLWGILKSSGFSGGTVFNPSLGRGVIEGMTPNALLPLVQMHGLEEGIANKRIVSALYPGVAIVESINQIPMSDAVVGELTAGFGELGRDGLTGQDKQLISALGKLKPGGVCCLLVDRSFLDADSTIGRYEAGKQAVLAGAIRLPDDANQNRAGRPSKDILVFVKQDREQIFDWVKVRNKLAGDIFYPVNNYFEENPSHVMGETIIESVGENGFGGKILQVKNTVHRGNPFELADISGAVDDILNNILASANVENELNTRLSKISERLSKPQETLVQIGEFSIDNGLIRFVRHINDGTPEYTSFIGKNKVDEGRLKGLIGLKDIMNESIVSQKADNEVRILSSREKLNTAYDVFVKKYGFINSVANRRIFLPDPDSGRLFALENYNDEKKTAVKADIFSKRVIFDRPTASSADSIDEAVGISLSEFGLINVARISQLLDESEKESELRVKESGMAFIDPKSGAWIVKSLYLGGDVKTKLDEAVLANDSGVFKQNIEALKSVIPADIPIDKIDVRFGAAWIEEDIINDFVGGYTNIAMNENNRLSYRRFNGQWIVPFTGGYNALAKSRETGRKTIAEILRASLNQEILTVKDPEIIDGKKKYVVNEDETLLVNEKMDELEAAFHEYIYSNPELSERIARDYNEKNNRFTSPNYDGSHLRFPGLSSSIELRDSQKSAVWRAICEGGALLSHEVGAGKTMSKVAIAMETQRIGLSTKPIIAVKNNMLEQIEREARQLYPSAKILTINKVDKNKIKEFMGKASNNHYDMIILTHGMLQKLVVPKKFRMGVIEEQIAEANIELDLISAMSQGHSSSINGKTFIKNQITSLNEQLARENNRVDPTGSIDIEMLGSDFLIVDEAHNFKNLEVVTTGTRSSLNGNIQGSQRAADLFMKARWMNHKQGRDAGVVFASGTIISNHVLEFYNLQRYLQPTTLKKMGFATAGAWSSNFLFPKTQWEPSPSGDGFRRKTRFGMQNVPELLNMMSPLLDIVWADNIPTIKRPEMITHNHVAELSQSQSDMMSELSGRVTKMSGASSRNLGSDNILKVISDGRKLSLDPRLVDPSVKKEDAGKVGLLVDQTLKSYTANNSDKGVQMIFCDQGVPNKNKPFVLYDDIKERLISGGIPAEEIAYIHDAKSDKAKAILFAKLRAGEKRVIIGSTEKMGEGTNAQDKISDIHHLDAPWRPKDIQQRDGRGYRHGNMFEKLNRHIYTTEGSFDLFMWNTMKMKSEAFQAVLSGDSTIRRFDLNSDPTYAETAAITSDNPRIKEKLEIDQQVSRYESLKRSHVSSIEKSFMEMSNLSRERISLEKSLKLIKGMPILSDNTIWELDLARYGMDSKFSGVSSKLLPVVRKLASTQMLNEIKGITYGGVNVTFRLDQTAFGSIVSWQTDCGALNVSRIGELQSLLDDIPSAIKETESNIKSNEAIRLYLEGVSQSTYEHTDLLSELLESQRKIDIELSQQEAQSQKNS